MPLILNRITAILNHRSTDSPVHRTVSRFIIATTPLPCASAQPVIRTAYAALIFFLFINGLWRDQLDSGFTKSPFINRNHFAGFIEMVWPPGLGLTLAKAHLWTKDRGYGKSPIQRLKLFLASNRTGFQSVLIFFLLLILLALLFSRSRAGITGTFIGFASFVLLMHIGGRRFSRPAWAAIGMGIIRDHQHALFCGPDGDCGTP